MLRKHLDSTTIKCNMWLHVVAYVIDTELPSDFRKVPQLRWHNNRTVNNHTLDKTELLIGIALLAWRIVRVNEVTTRPPNLPKQITRDDKYVSLKITYTPIAVWRIPLRYMTSLHFMKSVFPPSDSVATINWLRASLLAPKWIRYSKTWWVDMEFGKIKYQF